jgi:hypothetical protein
LERDVLPGAFVMRVFSILRFLDLKARIAIFALALFICDVWVTAYYFGQEARNNFQEVLAAQHRL